MAVRGRERSERGEGLAVSVPKSPKGTVVVTVVVAMAGLSGCTRTSTNRPPGPIVSSLFAVAADFGADADAITRGFSALQDIAVRVEKRHRLTKADIADDLNAVVFGEQGFEREIESTAAQFFQLTSVLRDRRGSCLGLGALYLAIGERIGIPLDGILLPGHFFIRTRGAHGHNVELLRRGETMPDAWYETKYGPWPKQGSAYGRPLSVTELVAIHWYNRGNEARMAGDLDRAERAYARAIRDFPDFAEAHASLGVVHHLRHGYAEAQASYREAARAWPDLPGLEHNLALLRQSQRPDSGPSVSEPYRPSAGSTSRQK
jgi:tetratricopeptide (TPR) repeat protein